MTTKRIQVLHPLADPYRDHPADTGNAAAHLADPYVAMRAAIAAALPDGWTVAREPIPHDGFDGLSAREFAAVRESGRQARYFRVARPGLAITPEAASGSRLVRTA